jgi:signal transduction histidine kinase
MIGINLDITERKHLEQALRDQDRRKDDFLATLAHELRNPLAPVRNGLQILKMAPAGGPVAERARVSMERQVGHMMRLIDDLLDVSRINSGKLELRRAPMQVQQVIEQAIDVSRALIDAAGHSLAVDMPEAPLWVDGDSVRLCQVMSNVLNNAAKYTPPGGRIKVCVTRHGDEVAIQVIDNGSGLSADMLPLVFSMYTQVDGRAEQAQGGLGIGLALVRKLVEMHEGSVTAESEGLGKGCVFTTRLPLMEPAQDRAVAAEEGPDVARGP